MLSGNINLSIRPIASYTLGYSDSILGYCYYTNDCRSFVIQIGSYWGWVPIPSFIPIHSGENRGNLRDQDAGKTSISDPLLLELASGRVR